VAITRIASSSSALETRGSGASPPGRLLAVRRVGARRADRDADAERLREHERVARPRAPVARDAALVHDPGDGQAVERDVVVDRVPARDDGARLRDLLRAAAQDLLEHLVREDLHRKRRERERHDRTPAHRVDVREGVRRRNRAEQTRIVDDRREEVDGLDDRRAAGQAVHRRVVRPLVPDEQARVRGRGQLLQKRGEVELTDLAGSTRARRERRERGDAAWKMSQGKSYQVSAVAPTEQHEEGTPTLLCWEPTQLRSRRRH
jgi:hypothetical protein